MAKPAKRKRKVRLEFIYIENWSTYTNMLRSALHHLKPLPMLERDVKANVNARTSKTQNCLRYNTRAFLHSKQTTIPRRQLPLFLSKAEGPVSLFTLEERNFRLKYLCWGDPLDNTFKEAVQGLIKICFPARVLD